jgi:dienelactone hydrolase
LSTATSFTRQRFVADGRKARGFKAMGYYQRFDANQSIKDAADALKVQRARPECKGKVGALCFCLGGKLAYLVAARTDVDCGVCYFGVGIEADLAEAGNVKGPMVFHFAELDGTAGNGSALPTRTRLVE